MTKYLLIGGCYEENGGERFDYLLYDVQTRQVFACTYDDIDWDGKFHKTILLESRLTEIKEKLSEPRSNFSKFGLRLLYALVTLRKPLIFPARKSAMHKDLIADSLSEFLAKLKIIEENEKKFVAENPDLRS